MSVYSFTDCDTLYDKNILIIGYGSQGRAQALNLRDSKVNNLIIGLHASSKSIKIAENEGFIVMPVSSAVNWADIIVFLAPDELHSDIYNESLKNNLRSGQTLIFAHGFSMYYKLIDPPSNINICMVSPKAIGPAVRSKYLENQGITCFTSVLQDYSKDTRLIMNSYTAAISLGKLIITTSFAEETESNLFAEQVVLCGGLPMLIKKSFDVLIEEGFSPEIAYWGCLHEVKLIADLIYKKGIAGTLNMVSNTAEYGGYLTGELIINNDVKSKMKKALQSIKNKEFLNQFLQDRKDSFSYLRQKRHHHNSHPIEDIGKKLRELIFNDKEES